MLDKERIRLVNDLVSAARADARPFTEHRTSQKHTTAPGEAPVCNTQALKSLRNAPFKSVQLNTL